MGERSRRILGAVFGAAMGLVYALVAQNINTLTLPGIPLYQPPPGRFTTILVTVVLGAILGLIASWPDDAIPGVMWSALTGILLSSIYYMLISNNDNGQLLSLAIIFIFTFLPRAVFLLPMAAITRWAVSIWQTELQTVSFSIKRLALSASAVLLVAGLAGLLSLYPRQGREALRVTQALIQKGQQAVSSEALPVELKPVDGFVQSAVGSYTLRLSDDPDQLPISRPAAGYLESEYAVLVRFANGYRFACVFGKPGTAPTCRFY